MRASVPDREWQEINNSCDFLRAPRAASRPRDIGVRNYANTGKIRNEGGSGRAGGRVNRRKTRRKRRSKETDKNSEKEIGG